MDGGKPTATSSNTAATGTNNSRVTPRASIALEKVFALSGRVGNPSAGGWSVHAAVTTSASGRVKVRLGGAPGDSTDALGARIPGLRVSSDVSSRCATSVWSCVAIAGQRAGFGTPDST